MFDQVANVFFDEANELLDNLEGYLLTLESEPDNQEVISAVFRAMHTIKGSSGMFGFDEISKFTHKMENTFDMVRNGIVPVTPQLINLTLQARDHIRSLLGAEITPELQNASQFIIEELNRCVEPYQNKNEQFSVNPTAPSPQELTAQIGLKTENASQSEEETQQTWRISFIPSANIMQNGTRPELLVKELAEMGTATVLEVGVKPEEKARYMELSKEKTSLSLIKFLHYQNFRLTTVIFIGILFLQQQNQRMTFVMFSFLLTTTLQLKLKRLMIQEFTKSLVKFLFPAIF